MARERACSTLILLIALACPISLVLADEPEGRVSRLPRHDRPPRKVIVGTTMTRWYSDYPGLKGRIEQMRGLIDEMAAKSRSKYGRSVDLALFTEYALTAGKDGPAVKVAVPLNDTTINALAAKARQHQCYIVFGGVFLDDAARGACSNAAIVLDRNGELVGRYTKVHPVLDRGTPEGQVVLEGGVTPAPRTMFSTLTSGASACRSVSTSNTPRAGDAWLKKEPSWCSTPHSPRNSLALACLPPPTNTGLFPPRSATTRPSSSPARVSWLHRSRSRSKPSSMRSTSVTSSFLGRRDCETAMPSGRHFETESATDTPNPKIAGSSGPTTRPQPSARWPDP